MEGGRSRNTVPGEFARMVRRRLADQSRHVPLAVDRREVSVGGGRDGLRARRLPHQRPAASLAAASRPAGTGRRRVRVHWGGARAARTSMDATAQAHLRRHARSLGGRAVSRASMPARDVSDEVDDLAGRSRGGRVRGRSGARCAIFLCNLIDRGRATSRSSSAARTAPASMRGGRARRSRRCRAAARRETLPAAHDYTVRRARRQKAPDCMRSRFATIFIGHAACAGRRRRSCCSRDRRAHGRAGSHRHSIGDARYAQFAPAARDHPAPRRAGTDAATAIRDWKSTQVVTVGDRSRLSPTRASRRTAAAAADADADAEPLADARRRPRARPFRRPSRRCRSRPSARSPGRRLADRRRPDRRPHDPTAVHHAAPRRCHIRLGRRYSLRDGVDR